MKIARTFVICILSLFVLSCSIEEQELSFLGSNQSYPEISLEDATYQISVDEGQPITVTGERISLYKEENRTVIERATFTQRDKDNELTLEGAFGQAEIDTITHDITMEKGVEITLHPSKLSISGDSLYYQEKGHLVSGKEDESITLTNKEGNILKGKGFKGNLDRQIFEFDLLEEGVLQYE